MALCLADIAGRDTPGGILAWVVTQSWAGTMEGVASQYALPVGVQNVNENNSTGLLPEDVRAEQSDANIEGHLMWIEQMYRIAYNRESAEHPDGHRGRPGITPVQLDHFSPLGAPPLPLAMRMRACFREAATAGEFVHQLTVIIGGVRLLTGADNHTLGAQAQVNGNKKKAALAGM